MALYETAKEMREIAIDAFARQTGRGDVLRKLVVAGATVAGGLALAGGIAAPLVPAAIAAGTVTKGVSAR